MPIPPTEAEIDQAIINVIKDRHQQPNTIFPVMQIHLPLQQAGLTADEINAGLGRLAEKGWLKSSTGPHWTLTAAGHAQFGPPPSDDEIERAVLDQIQAYHPAPNTIFPVMRIKVKLQGAGLTSQQITDALQRMVDKGWLKPGKGPHWTITEDGHREL